MKYLKYINQKVRVISVVIFENGRVIKTEYYGVLIYESSNHIIIEEADKKRIKIDKKFVKRVDKNV